MSCAQENKKMFKYLQVRQISNHHPLPPGNSPCNWQHFPVKAMTESLRNGDFVNMLYAAIFPKQSNGALAPPAPGRIRSR
jgi:hypothetical protein